MRLTENQVTAIKLLARYKYLTSSQFVKIGLYKQKGYLTKALKALVEMKTPLIDKHNFSPLNGKLESFYYLTKYAQQFLMEELEYRESKIKVVKGRSSIYLKDYYHRRYTLDFHIYFRKWIEANGGEVDFFNYYFDKAGNNRSANSNSRVTALNRIHIDKSNSFIPDANTMFSLDSKQYLYLFEQHNGKDTKRLFEQLYVHIIAISKGAVSEKYKIKKSPVVVVVCEYDSVKESVIKRLQKERGIENYNNFFIFKTNAELEEDFYNNWTLISGKKSTFFPKSARQK